MLGLASSSCDSGQQLPVSDAREARVVKSHPDEPGRRWLAHSAEAAEEQGAGPLRVVGFGSGAPGDVVDAFVFIPQERCALVYARGNDTIEDLDLHAFGDDGTEFGSDEAPDAEPSLLICPERDTRLYLAARVAQGHGVLALGLHDLAPQDAVRIARAIGARNHSSDPRDVDEPWPGLGEALELHREEIGGHWIDQRRVALPVDSRVATHISVTVPAQRCLDALALASDEVARLELLAEDENGRIFARGRQKGPNRSLLFCAGEQAQELRLMIRPHAGRGLAVLTVSTTRGPQDRFDLNPAIPVEYLSTGDTAKSDSPSPFAAYGQKAFTARGRALLLANQAQWLFTARFDPGCRASSGTRRGFGRATEACFPNTRQMGRANVCLCDGKCSH